MLWDKRYTKTRVKVLILWLSWDAVFIPVHDVSLNPESEGNKIEITNIHIYKNNFLSLFGLVSFFCVMLWRKKEKHIKYSYKIYIGTNKYYWTMLTVHAVLRKHDFWLCHYHKTFWPLDRNFITSYWRGRLQDAEPCCILRCELQESCQCLEDVACFFTSWFRLRFLLCIDTLSLVSVS